MLDPRIREDNSAQNARLEQLVARLSDADLQLDLGDGWRVYVALAHLGFWDRRAAYVLQRWAKDGVPFTEMDDDVVNRALEEEWRALDPRVATDLAISAARAVDLAASQTPEEIVATLVADGNEWLLHRANHRREHIEQIESALAKRGP